MKVVTPKENLTDLDADAFSIFLSGGMSKPWRKELIDKLAEEDFYRLVVFDPTVEDWENEVGDENFENEKYINQISWEHLALIRSDINIFRFDGSSPSPITLVELALNRFKDAIILLEDDYEKAAYVRILATKFNLPIVQTEKALLSLFTIKYHSRLTKV